jgi:ribonuclease III
MITQSINSYFSSTLDKKELTNKKIIKFFASQKIFREFLQQNNLSLPWRPEARLKVVGNYLAAFTHSSFLNEYKEIELRSYEKLEFFGDVILNFLLTEMIFNKYPELSEGELSKFKSAIVAKAPLAKLSQIQDLPKLLLQGRGELSRPVGINILGDLFESVMAAIYLHQGIDSCRQFLKRTIDLYDDASEEAFLSPSLIDSSDHKTKLQELTMKRFRVLPRYQGEQIGNGSFVVELFVGEQIFGRGQDRSKKVAEKNAAKQAYENLLNINDKNNKAKNLGDDYAH